MESDADDLTTPEKLRGGTTKVARSTQYHTDYATPQKSIQNCSSCSNISYPNQAGKTTGGAVTMMQYTASCSSSGSNNGHGSICSHNTHSVQVVMTAVNTPPPKRFQQRVRNPFEAALTDRLHLPIIGSPSLFQRPATPQMSSTQFEWTIDEVSSLLPAHVEPHETQFHDSPDPDYEAKAQSAISSYFKEQQIVPSPVDCPLRNQRIILSELNGNTPISKPGRRIRDFGTQTELSLPVNLPKELEEALKPYLQPQLAGAGREWHGVRKRSNFEQIEHLNSSMRRKLFDMHNVVIFDPALHSNANSLELSQRKPKQPKSIVGKLSDSLDKSTCGSLSPISAHDSLSISSQSPSQNSPTRRKIRMLDFADEQLSPIATLNERPWPATNKAGGGTPLASSRRSSDDDYHCRDTDITCAELTAMDAASDLSPIAPLQRKIAISIRRDYRTEHSRHSDITFAELPNVSMNNDKFSPDSSSSPVPTMHAMNHTARAFVSSLANGIGNCSRDSFNLKISRLVVNSAKCPKPSPPDNEHYLLHDDTTTDLIEDDDDMQASQLSVLSSNCSSNSDTPRNKRRSASRKNLSQSFSASWLQADDDAEELEQVAVLQPKSTISVSKMSNDAESKVVTETIIANVEEHEDEEEEELCSERIAASGEQLKRKLSKQEDEGHRVNFYRTDSGFNEMTPSTSVLSSQEELSRDAVMPQLNVGVSEKLGTVFLKEAAELDRDISMISCCSTPTRFK